MQDRDNPDGENENTPDFSIIPGVPAAPGDGDAPGVGNVSGDENVPDIHQTSFPNQEYTSGTKRRTDPTEHLPTYLRFLYRRDGLDGRGLACNGRACRLAASPPSSTAQEPIFRCIDCLCLKLYCKTCIIARHATLPFHRLERWIGKRYQSFVRTTLDDLGYELCLGHSGDRCHFPIQGTQAVNVLDTHGQFRTQVVYCGCPAFSDDPREIPLPLNFQLLLAGIYPSTTVHPKSGFTFDLLEHFHTLHLSSTISMYNFHKAVSQLTNTDNPSNVPVSPNS